MILRRFIDQGEMTIEAMAKKLDCSESAVRKWYYGQRVPRFKHIAMIQRITRGQVTANDFYEVSKIK